MMQWYGSLQNRLQENMPAIKPQLGMGATEILYTDRHAYEVIAVKDERHCTVRQYECKIKEGTSWYDQEYDYISNPRGRVVNLFLTKKGKWVQRYPSGRYGNTFRMGIADEYYDPSF